MSIKEIQYQCLERNIPFYCYRLPGAQEVVMGIQSSPEVLPSGNFEKEKIEKGFLIAPFVISAENAPLFIREDFRITGNTSDKELEDWICSVHFESEGSESPEYIQPQEEYLEEVADLVRALNGDKLSKVVYSRVIALKKSFTDNFGLFQALMHSYPDAFAYYFHIPGNVVWMGATPELFLEVQPEILKTIALAGTKKTPNESWSGKEYREQEYVSRFIREVFDSCSLKEREESAPKAVRAGECIHLKTDFSVRANLSGSGINQLIKLLHPTPAVCGYPQKEAMNEILKREKHNRQFYSGFLGPVSAINRMNLFVNLRCMRIGREHVELFVGGGITKDSDPQEEWNETVLKAQTLMNLIS